MWTHHRFSKCEVLVNLIKNHSFFSGFSEQTIYLIAFELIKVKKFTPNTLVISQSKRSNLNFCYREFFENKMADVQLEIIH